MIRKNVLIIIGLSTVALIAIWSFLPRSGAPPPERGGTPNEHVGRPKLLLPPHSKVVQESGSSLKHRLATSGKTREAYFEEIQATPDPETSKQMMAALIEITDDPDLLLRMYAWIHETTQGNATRSLEANLLAKLATVSPDESLRLLWESDPGTHRGFVIASVLSALPPEFFAKHWREIESNLMQDEDHAAFGSRGLDDWLSKIGYTNLQEIGKNAQSNALKTAAARALAKAIGGWQNADALRSDMEQLPDDVQSAFVSAALEFVKKDQIWNLADDFSKTKYFKSATDPMIINNFTNFMLEADPARGMTWLTKLDLVPDVQERAIQLGINAWITRNPMQASKWATTLAPGPALDVVAYSLASQLDPVKENEAYLAWANMISQEKYRQKLLSQLKR